MKTFVEIQIRLNLNKDETLHDVLGRFACESKVWTFLLKDSEIYQNSIEGEGGCLICDGVTGIERALVAIATARSKQPKLFYVANIVPRDCFELTMDQYNAIASAFARHFGCTNT